MIYAQAETGFIPQSIIDFSGNAGYTSETPVHEFGHFLGLAHQANSTNSFMSYSVTRNAVPVSPGIRRLVNAYR